jgi:hypothetical protein
MQRCGHRPGQEVGITPAHAGSLAVDHLAGLTARVTPAPAGSVSSPWASWWPARHPRWRRAEAEIGSLRPPSYGSSLLARVLPDHRRHRPESCRVTPARAGATPPRSRGSSCRSSHPRSRGRCSTCSVAPRCGGESSSLARTLLSLSLAILMRFARLLLWTGTRLPVHCCTAACEPAARPAPRHPIPRWPGCAHCSAHRPSSGA